MTQKIVEIPGVGVVEFPDSMSDEAIAAVIKTQMMGKPPRPSGPSPDNRPASHVMQDLAADFLSGIPQAITSIPGAVMGAGLAIDELAKAPTRMMLGQKSDLTNTKALAEGIISGPRTMARNAGALADAMGVNEGPLSKGYYPLPQIRPQTPTAEETSEVAQMGGATVGGVMLGGGAAKALNAVRTRLPSVAEKLYQKGLQPSPRTYSAADIKALVKTGLKEELPITQTGLNKLDDLVNKLNASIEADIASNPNAPVSRGAVGRRMYGPTIQKARTQVNPTSDVKAVQSSVREFIQTQPSQIPAEAAQALKKGTYKQIYGKGEGELGTSAKNAQAQLARGLKEELETIFPEIKGKNLREGAVLDLRPELEAAINRLGNRRVSLPNVVNLLADPAVTSKLAIALNKMGVPPGVASLRIAKLAGSSAAFRKQEQK